jgi:hypothetical protein
MYVIAVTIYVWTTYTILPTYVKGPNVAVGDYRHNRTRLRHTKGDSTRYEMMGGYSASNLTFGTINLGTKKPLEGKSGGFLFLGFLGVRKSVQKNFET